MTGVLFDAAEAVVSQRVKAPPSAKAEGKLPRSAPTATYTVFIRDLQVETCVGAFAHERQKATVLWLDIEMEVSCRAGATDRLDDAVDYGAVVADLRQSMAGKRYYLLEKVCEFVASRILDKFGASRVWVSVAKHGIIDRVGKVGVTAVRRNAGVGDSHGALPARSPRSRFSAE